MFFFTISLLFGVLLTACFLFELKKWRLNSTKLKAYAALKEFPIIGVGGYFIGKDNDGIMHTIDSLSDKANEKPLRAWFGPQLIIYIDQPDDIQVVLNADQLLNKPYMYKHVSLKTGLIASPKEMWKQHRRALNQTFNTKVLKKFIPVYNEKAHILTKRMEHSVGQPIDINRLMFKAVGDVVLNTGLGMNWQFQTQRGDEIYDTIMAVMSFFLYRVSKFWLRWDYVYSFTKENNAEQKLVRKIHQFLRSVQEVKAIELAAKMTNGDDILESAKATNCFTWIEKCFLMNRDGLFTEQNVNDQIDTFFFAATDTTSVTVTAVLLMLAIHQEYQEKVVAELRDIFNSADSPVTYEDLSKMMYIEMVIKETLRLFPIGPIIARECSEDFAFRNGVVPKGTIVVINFWKLHKNAKYWGEKSHQFYPNHFLPESFNKMHPYTYMPFSGGPRNCIGTKYAWISMKVMLAHLLRRYKFITDLKMEDVRTKICIILKIANENPIRTEHREF